MRADKPSLSRALRSNQSSSSRADGWMETSWREVIKSRSSAPPEGREMPLSSGRRLLQRLSVKLKPQLSFLFHFLDSEEV